MSLSSPQGIRSSPPTPITNNFLPLISITSPPPSPTPESPPSTIPYEERHLASPSSSNTTLETHQKGLLRTKEETVILITCRMHVLQKGSIRESESEMEDVVEAMQHELWDYAERCGIPESNGRAGVQAG